VWPVRFCDICVALLDRFAVVELRKSLRFNAGTRSAYPEPGKGGGVMLIQKTFHLHFVQEVAKARLANPAGYRWRFVGVEIAEVMPEGRAHFVFRLPWGFRVDVELVQLPGENPAQTLFRSSRGNVAVLGVLEYFPIRPGLTEVVLTLDYTITSPFCRFIDYLGHSIDRFLNRQLERLEIHFDQPQEGIRADTNLPKPINHHPHVKSAEQP